MPESGEIKSQAAKSDPQTTSPPPSQQPQTAALPLKRPQQLESSPNPTTPSVTDPKDVTPTTISSRITEPDFIYIPSYSRKSHLLFSFSFQICFCIFRVEWI